MKTLTLELPDDLYERVERGAAESGTSPGQEVVKLLARSTNATDNEILSEARTRMQQLFQTVKGFRLGAESPARHCMNAEVFVDTNVFLYTIDEDPASNEKRERARQLLLSERWGWSVQVAAEFFVNATSPKRPFRLSSPDAAAFVETWLAFPTQSVTPDLVRAAIDLQQRFQLKYWDAAILAAAKQLGCRTAYSEDLNAGQDYNGVRVVNPFVSAAKMDQAT